MDSDGLQVDTAVLHDAGRSLAAVWRELESAPGTTDPGADVVAHDRLRDRLRHIGSGWDRARRDTIDALQTLGESAVAAAQTYERLDTELAGALWGGR